METDPLTELFNSVDISSLELSKPSSPRYIEDNHWFRKNRNRFSQYEGQWIAVYQKKMIAHDVDCGEVKQKAFQLLKREVDDICLRFIENPTALY